MAAGDLALNVLVTANVAQASGAMALLGGSMLRLGETGLKGISKGLSNLAFGFRNLGTSGTIGMDALKQGAVGLGASILQLGLVVGTIGVIAAIAFGAVAIHAAADYQSALTRLYTTAGEAKNKLQLVGDGMLAMSTQVGIGAQTLAQAMYYVESAGFHGAQGLQVLKIAAEGSKAENSDLTSVVKTLVSALNAYAGTGLTASAAMNTLIAATSQGHMTLNDLAGGLSNVLPASARFGISLIDTTAAIAEMTKQGDNAASAATHLRQMFLAFEAPSKIGAAAMKSVGLSSQQLADELRKSVPGAIAMVDEAVGKKFPEGSAAYNQAVKNIAGGSRQMMGYLELSGKHLKDFGGIVKAMSGDVKSGGSSIMGWAAIQGNFNFKMDQAKAAVEALFIKIGTALLPVMTNLVGQIAPLIVGFTTWLTTGGRLQAIIGFISAAFAFLGTAIAKIIQIGVGIVNFFRQNEVAGDALKATLILVAIVVGVVLVAAFIAATIAVGIFTIELLANPITWIVIAIIAVITGIILVITHWGQIMTWFGNVMSAVGTFVHGVLSAMGAWFGSVFSAIGTAVHNALTGIKNTVGNVFSAIGTTVRNALTGIKDTVGNVFSAIGTFLHNLITGFQNLGGAFNIVKVLLIIVFFPFIVIIGLIIVIIRHWGAIMAWFGGLFSTIGSGIHSHLVELGKGFSDLGTSAHKVVTAIGGAFSWLGGIAHVAVSRIGDAFSWLGTQVQRFLAFIQPGFNAVGTGAHTAATGIGNFFSMIGSGAHAAASKLGDFFSMIGTGVHAAVTAIGNFFSMIGTGAHAAVTAIGNFFQMIGNFLSPIVNFATMVVHWFTWLWDTLVGHSIIPNMIAAIGRAFLKLLSNIPIVGGLVQGVIGLFSHMADAITNKTEQMRIQSQLKMTQMRIASDTSTITMAQHAIANLEIERAGILQKLKETHDPAQRMELEHQLKMLDIQQQAVNQKLALATKDKLQQLAKQKELHAQALEAQKWFGQRFLDMMGSWIGDQFNKLGTMVSGWMSKLGQWKDQAVTKATEMVTNFTSMIAQLPGKVGGWIANMASTMLSKLAALAGQALSAGANIVKNIASGIIGAIGSFLGNAMSQVGSFISSHLPHSPAKIGPLRDLQLQGSLIPQQIAQGMLSGKAHLGTALQQMLAPIGAGATGNTAFALQGRGSSSASGGGGGYGVMNLCIKLDSREIAEAVGIRMAKEVRINGARNR